MAMPLRSRSLPQEKAKGPAIFNQLDPQQERDPYLYQIHRILSERVDFLKEALPVEAGWESWVQEELAVSLQHALGIDVSDGCDLKQTPKLEDINQSPRPFLAREYPIYALFRPKTREKADIFLQHQPHGDRWACAGFEIKCRNQSMAPYDRPGSLVEHMVNDIRKFSSSTWRQPMPRTVSPEDATYMYAMAITCDPNDLRRESIHEPILRENLAGGIHWCHLDGGGGNDVYQDLNRRGGDWEPRHVYLLCFRKKV